MIICREKILSHVVESLDEKLLLKISDYQVNLPPIPTKKINISLTEIFNFSKQSLTNACIYAFRTSFDYYRKKLKEYNNNYSYKLKKKRKYIFLNNGYELVLKKIC